MRAVLPLFGFRPSSRAGQQEKASAARSEVGLLARAGAGDNEIPLFNAVLRWPELGLSVS
ncbi:MAG: hypothetical protein LBG71_00710 [Clostridiales Family XIII bacterium]|nr:hypothetical protein [Clostridiales Family XIII bacterium]